jgi:fatty acid desaturase
MMIDQAFVIRGMDGDTMRHLSRRSNTRGLLQLAVHATCLLASGTLIWASRGTYWLPPAIILHGVMLNFLFCALHETIHRSAFASRWANDAVAAVCSALLLLPREYFRLFHFAHHRFTQDPARDPELAQPHPTTFISYLWRLTGAPNWIKRLTITLQHALTGRVPQPFIPAVKRPTIVREARYLWICYLGVVVLSLAFRSTAALFYWVFPLIAGQPFLRLFLLSEHAGCAAADSPFANTRTTYTNAAVRLLAWQMSFHVEHHAFPAIPFHALGKVNVYVRGHIEVSAPGYVALHRTLIRRLRQ